MTVRAHDGSQWYLIEVIAFMIQHAKDWLEDHLSRSPTPLKTTDFNWVITVPAIWQARGRGMMREAAYMVSTDIFTMIKMSMFYYIYTGWTVFQKFCYNLSHHTRSANSETTSGKPRVSHVSSRARCCCSLLPAHDRNRPVCRIL